ncbi:MAG: Gfo/Idh/MocA family oxidoreductase [Clostridia bacterium]|nr:Gfo/Idh/MocA family oxidoreductase [Clostridia bacterium]
MKNINAGVIGLGCRGSAMLDLLLQIEGVTVSWVCDLYEDRIAAGIQAVEKAGQKTPLSTQSYRDMLSDPSLDAVFIFSAWENHVPAAVDCMLAGKCTAMEVGGAYSIDDCWQLVRTYEKTKTPFMLLENCCYGKRETMVLNMVRKGLFGEVVHCRGGYCHDLREEVAFGKENRHYRLKNYLHRNCENYPTHELGPIAKVLNINRGNCMLSLVSVASKAAGMKEYIKQKKPDDAVLMNADFAQGDIITTVITCADGATILLTLDTTLPRSYSRGFTVQGTKGMYSEESDSVYLDGVSTHAWEAEPTWGTAKHFEEHLSPVWKDYMENGIKGGHGGIDWLELCAFVDCVRSGAPMPIDVYDAAAWMAVTPLSEASIATGNAVAFPDFTNGAWTDRAPLDVL